MDGYAKTGTALAFFGSVLYVFGRIGATRRSGRWRPAQLWARLLFGGSPSQIGVLDTVRLAALLALTLFGLLLAVSGDAASRPGPAQIIVGSVGLVFLLLVAIMLVALVVHETRPR